MKTKKLLLVLLLTLIQGFAYAETTTQKSTMDMLMSIKWELPIAENKNITSFMVFDLSTKTLMVSYESHGEHKKLVTKESYYLSDEIDTIFNENKVDKVRNGKYLILSKSDKPKDKHEKFSVMEIVNLNENELTMRSATSNNKGEVVLGGGSITYKAVAE